MSKIKTRETVKNIKTLDKAAAVGARMKNAFIRSKDTAVNLMDDGQVTPSEYAGDKVQYAAEDLSHDAAHLAGSGTKTAVQKGRETFRRHQEKKVTEKMRDRAFGEDHSNADPNMECDRALAKKQAQNRADTAQQIKNRAGRADRPAQGQSKTRDSFGTPRRSKDAVDHVTHTIKQPARTVKQTAKSTGKATAKTAKGTIKTSQRAVKTAKHTSRAAVKTAQRTSKTTIKTAQATAKATQRAAQATAKAAKLAIQSARAAAKAAATTAKAAAKAVAAAVKAMISAIQALIAAIAAGGWVAVLVIVIICLIALIVGSCFGIFFSSEDTGSDLTMSDVVQEINTEYQDKLDEIKLSNSYDVLEMSGSRAVWPEVLAIYAVKTTTDPENSQKVVTMDDAKKGLLIEIFWAMNGISSRTESVTETVITESDDGNGNIVETQSTVTRTYLYITVSHKSAEEMADGYNFTADQRQQLAELLAEENSSLWSAVLYGIEPGDGEIVTVALSQLGNMGGDPYWSWYGFTSRVEWCACFVSWCANECGYIETGVIPKFAACVNGEAWFRERGLWQDNSYEPRAGDLIFFDWDDEDGQDGITDHVGIVEKVENGIVYTVEGNSGDSCRQRSYSIGYYEIYGYGTPAY